MLTNKQVAEAILANGDPDGECQVYIEDSPGRGGYYAIKAVEQVGCSDPLAVVIETGDCIATS